MLLERVDVVILLFQVLIEVSVGRIVVRYEEKESDAECEAGENEQANHAQVEEEELHLVALRWLHKNDPNKASNADALLGRTGRVTETIKAGNSGYVQIDGDMWKAVSQKDIAVGETVRVIGRESTIITVDTL